MICHIYYVPYSSMCDVVSQSLSNLDLFFSKPLQQEDKYKYKDRDEDIENCRQEAFNFNKI